MVYGLGTGKNLARRKIFVCGYIHSKNVDCLNKMIGVMLIKEYSAKY